MLPVETNLHLQLKVAAPTTGINDLVAWAHTLGMETSRAVVARVLWEAQEACWSEISAGRAPVSCARCGSMCSGDDVVRRGSRARKIRSSSGEVAFRLLQVTCRACGRTWSPFSELLGIAPRQRISEELLKTLCEGVIHLSYAKTTQLAHAWLGASVTPSTLHRAVQDRSSQIRFTAAQDAKVIVADGTRVRCGRKKTGEEYVVAFEIEGYGTKDGRASVKKRVAGFGIGRGGWDAAFATIADPELVVTDGEQGLRECVARHFPRARHQLCEWHVPYTLSYLMLMDGELPLQSRKRWRKQLGRIIQCRQHDAYERFTRRFRSGTHSRAFLEYAKPYIMYRRRSAVRTTSWAERQMREYNRRTDVGVNWSMNGIANLLKLKLARLHNRDDYERAWSPPNPLVWNLVPRT